MTDKYGSDREQHEAGADQEQSMTGDNETWTGEPPVDDFHAGEEAAIVSEETEVPDEAAVAQTGGKKKSIILPLIAGSGGLLFLGAVLYWQFGNSPSTSIPVAQVPPLSTTTAQAGFGSPAAPSPSLPASTDYNVKPPPTDVAPTTALASVTDAPASPLPTPAQPTLTTPAAPAPMPDAAVSALPVKPAAVAPTAAAMMATSPSGPSVNARLDDLSNHVEDLQKSLTQATEQLSQVSAALAANTASPAVVNSAIDDRLNKIEQKLMQMQHATVTLPSMSSDASPEMTTKKSLAVKHTHRPSHKRVSTKSVKMTKAKKRPNEIIEAEQERPLSSTHWVLRAATPDEAWVAEDSTSLELRHVRVGDSLPGVGTVLAIRQNGDNWMVEGSKGNVQ